MKADHRGSTTFDTGTDSSSACLGTSQRKARSIPVPAWFSLMYCRLQSVLSGPKGFSCWVLLAVLGAGMSCSSSSDEPRDDAPDGQSYTVIHTGNHVAVLESVFSVASAESFRAFTDAIDTVYGDEPAGIPDEQDFLVQVSSTYDPENLLTRYEYTCSEGGSYRFLAPGFAVGGGSGQFDACRFDAIEHSGSFTRINTLVKYVYSPGWSVSTSYAAVSLKPVATESPGVIDGNIERFTGENENTERWDVVNLVQPGESGEIRASGVLLQLYAGDQRENPENTDPWKRTFSGSFSLTAPQTGGNPLTVSTEEKLVTQQRTGTYTSGVLRVKAEDGSELRVVVDNGDPASFQVDVSNGSSVSSFTYPWEGSLRLRCLADPEDPESVVDSCR